LFSLGRFASGDDSDDIASGTETMAYHQNAQLGAYAKQEKPILPFTMSVVIEFDSVCIEEHCLSFFERDPVFPPILLVLLLVPLELQFIHNDTVNIP